MIGLSMSRRRRGPQPSEDGGFALIFVMIVTMLITIGTATMLTVTASDILPAKHSQDAEAATAAAEAGIQAFVAKLNAECVVPTTTCDPADIPTTQLGNEQYQVTVLGQVDNTEFRIQSTGTSPVGGADQASRTLIADVSGAPSPLRYAYFSDYETTSGQFVVDYLPAAQIPVSSSSAAGQAINLSGNVTAAWPGVPSSQAAACDKHYYDGRSAAYIGSDSAGNPVVFSESSGGVTGQITGSCEVMFSDGMTFDGPVYSQDAMLLSKGTDGGTGPSFDPHTLCSGSQLPSSTSPCETLYPASSAWAGDGTYVYRRVQPTSFAPSITTLVQHSPANLQLPAGDSDAAGEQNVITCVGPTDVTLSGASVVLSGGCNSTVQLDQPRTIYVTGGGNAGWTSVPCSESGLSAGITQYATNAGDACVHGSISQGKLSIVAAHDVIVTGDIKAPSSQTTNIFGEDAWQSGPALDVVAQNDVVVYHPVTCRTGSAIPNATTSGDSPAYAYCKNDITGLYSSDDAGSLVKSDGSLFDGHPARQYCNADGTACTGTSAQSCSYSGGSGRTIQAAVFALRGSLLTDNYNRGCALGQLHVTGGVYEHHRGAVGEEWEVASGLTQRAYSGYKLKIDYLSYLDAQLPYVPALQAGSATAPWIVLAVSSKATS